MNDIRFVDADVTVLYPQLKAMYEQMVGVKLQEGDPANDFIQWVTYVCAMCKENINYTGLMNLVNFATGEFLDELAIFVGTERKAALGSQSTIKYTFSKIFTSVQTIPKGHKVAAGSLYFTLDKEIELPIGSRTTTGTVTCTSIGNVGDNLAIGEINTIVDDIPYLIKVENITESGGGVDEETDDSLRERVKLRPYSFSVAGPVKAYKYWVLTANQGIIDTYIYTPDSQPGVVKIYVIMQNGELPTSEVNQQIVDILADDVRPFTDKVEVLMPTTTNYNIDADYYIKKGDDIQKTKTAIEAALQDYIYWQRIKLGRDLNPSKLTEMLVAAGAKRVVIRSPVFTKINADSVCREGTVALNYAGEEDE